MSKHTPGPWKFSFESVDPEWAVVATIGGAVICNVNADHRQDANARLIAAAPDLLKALKGIRADAERFALDVAADAQEGGKFNSCEYSKWQAVAAAIAKAEGGQ